MQKRNSNRLTLIRQFPCSGCGMSPPSQACHANWLDCGKGIATKASDDYTIPLCAKCHRELDTYQGRSREQAKNWFMQKLTLVNQWLNQKMPEDGVEF